MPLFRPEAALYTKVPLIARQTTLFTLGTFHQRHGDQMLLQGSGPFASRLVSWRPWLAFAGSPHSRLRRPGAAPTASRSSSAGPDRCRPSSPAIWSRLRSALTSSIFERRAHTDRAGVFYAYTETGGEGRGFIRAVNRALAGTLNMDTDNIGAYWTHIGPSQWYVDAVLMGTFFNADPLSNRGIGANLDGDGVTASIEAGVPVRFTPYLSLEAQGQLIWQRLQFDPASDPFTTLKFGLDDSFIGRFGLRLEGETLAERRAAPAIRTGQSVARIWRH